MENGNLTLTWPELEEVTEKVEKLHHYAHKPINEFTQFDAFINVTPGDAVVIPDKDGDSIFGCFKTKELMSGVPVRLLVKPGTKKEDALRIIKKFADMIKRKENPFPREPDTFEDNSPF